jgi:hypothetical protein
MSFTDRFVLLVLVFLAFNAVLFAESEIHIIPMLNYDYVSLEKQQYHAPGAGLMFTMGNLEPQFSEEKDSFVVGAMYKSFIMSEERDSASLFHDVTLMMVRKIKRHLILAIANSHSTEPVYGGFHTVVALAGYGYEFVRNENYFLTLGLCIAANDFGDINGKMLPVLPLPIVQFGIDYSWINAYLEFIAGPTLYITIGPKSKIRLITSFNMSEYRSIEDLNFECALWYRFFDANHRLGDFAGFALGVKNDNRMFNLKKRGDRYGIGYYSAFAKLDLSFLQITGGYAFNGREHINSNKSENAGNGFFVSAQLAYRF